jgi:hypothetical protein
MRVWSGRLDEEEAPALDVQNACQRGSSGSALNFILGSDVAKVPAEPTVRASRREHRRGASRDSGEVVRRNEPRRLPQRGEPRIGIVDEGRVGGAKVTAGTGMSRKTRRCRAACNDAFAGKFARSAGAASFWEHRCYRLARLGAVIVDPFDLRTVLMRVCRDAAIEPETCVAWIVDAARPEGATPIAYLHPAGRVRRDTVQVFRAVGAERARAFEGSAHRLSVWRHLPGLPESALGPMLRHELAHAERWEQSGTAFFEADERLRAAADGRTYARLPTEREANAAAAAYAQDALSQVDLAELARIPELAELLDAQAPADVVGETLALVGQVVEVAPARVESRAEGPVVELVAPAFVARAGGDR